MSDNRFFNDVEDFHRDMGFAPFVDVDPDAVTKKRIAILNEEAGEFCEALAQGSKPEILHEGIDLLYVILGGLLEAGITWPELSTAWSLVHAANMSKDAPADPLGKAVKGDRFQKADVSKAIGAKLEAKRFGIVAGNGKGAKAMFRSTQGPMDRTNFEALVSECLAVNGQLPSLIVELL